MRILGVLLALCSAPSLASEVAGFQLHERIDAAGNSRQLAEARQFLTDLSVDVSADTKQPFLFQELVLVPEEAIDQGLLQQGTRLILRTSEEVLSSYRIRQMWDRGDHLTSERERKIWPYLNPAGTFRIGVRQTLSKAREDLLKKIGLIRTLKTVNEKRDALKSILSIAKLATSSDEQENQIEDLDEVRLELFLAHLEEKVKEPSRVGELEKATVSAIGQSRSARDYDVEINSGLISYGNIHNIHVEITASRWGTLIRAMEVPRTTKVRVNGKLFAGFTIDDITVTLDFSGALEASAIEDALDILP